MIPGARVYMTENVKKEPKQPRRSKSLGVLESQASMGLMLGSEALGSQDSVAAAAAPAKKTTSHAIRVSTGYSGMVRAQARMHPFHASLLGAYLCLHSSHSYMLSLAKRQQPYCTMLQCQGH